MKGCIRFLISATKWLPVVVASAIFFWGWYAYTFQLALNAMQSTVQQILCLVIFNIVFIFALWSYVQTIFTPIGQIPGRFYLTPEISEDLVRAPSDQHRDEILAYVVKRNDLPVACRTYSGGIRYCEKCNLIKPDRCHHCSICGVCILKMDHHCPWINNCVSFTNYKFFVLFLGYTFAMCLFTAATTLPYFLKFWIPQDTQFKTNDIGTGVNATFPGQQQPQPQPNNLSMFESGLNYNNSVPFSTRFQILFLFFISTILSLGLVFLYSYHIYLLLNNRSTLEAFRPPLMTYGADRNAFNLGKKENWHQLFGRSKLFWLVPIFTTEGSGLTYDQRLQLGQGDEEVRQELLNPYMNRNNSNNRPAKNTDSEV